jgi:hypothetical protein
VHTFTGWCKIGEVWAYLHAGGAIGTVGTVESAYVELPGDLQNFLLPAPPEGEERIASVRASLDLVRGLAPDEVMLPLLAATYGAVLPGATIVIFISGQTGSGKSELSALMQQHYGAEMDAKHLPANWSSTGNALEALAFAAKDTLLVVDDFKPIGSQADVARLHKEADRLFRAQGNRSGRQRCRPDGSPKAGKAPRGTVLSTGEDTPHGHSTRARMLILEREPPDAEFWSRLTECQAQAARGLYAQAMAAYTRWIAPQYERVVARRKDEAARLRDAINAGPGPAQHKRTPTTVADLATGFELFLEFAEEIGAISHEQAVELGSRCRLALLKTAAEQQTHQDAADPCRLYLGLVRSALSSGRAYVADRDGGRPADSPEACGWRRREGTNGAGDGWYPQGRCIGWVDGLELYLEPGAAYAEANRLAGEQGGSLGVSKDTLQKRLADQRWLASAEKDRQRRTVRRTLAGARHEVLHFLAARVLCVEDTVPIVPTVPLIEKQAENGTVSWDGCATAPDNRPTRPSHLSEENEAFGTDGTVGTAPRAYTTDAERIRTSATPRSPGRTRGAV